MRRATAAAAVAAVLVVAGCASAPPPDLPDLPDAAPRVRQQTSGTPAPVPARLAEPARSQRTRFVPDRVELPGGSAASVVPADTVDGVLRVPQDVRRVGWWTGSAYVGDPFGATVIAGHVDSAEQGIGFFARLLRIREGERVTVRGSGHAATYRVAFVGLVDKQALERDGKALDQNGEPRLVLITCAGEFRPEKGGYESNLVVVAEPVGSVR